MSKSLTIEGKTFLPSTALAGRFSYTSDYLTKLAREGKVTATRVGRQWFIEEASLQKFAATVHEQKSLRRHELRQERVAERLKGQEAIRASVLAKNEPVRKVKVKLLSLPSKMVAISQTALVLLCGVFVGLLALTVHEEDITLAELKGSTVQIASEFVSITHFGSNTLHPRGQVALADFSVWWNWFFDREETELVSEMTESRRVPETQNTPGVNGGLVLLDRNTTTTTIESIAQSFSDEVEVTFSDDRSGVITPVFTESADESYRFLLVPITRSETP